jgi:hypothetical protein
MVSHTAWKQTFDFLDAKPVVVEPGRHHLTSDAGLLPIREFDEQIGLTQQFSDGLVDPRHPSFTRHQFAEMTRSRIYGILAGYEDQNDHDALRNDPVFKLVAGREPDAPELASQPTLSRFENAISVESLIRLDIRYSNGAKLNSVLKRESKDCLDAAVDAFEAGEGPQRRFTQFAYRAGTWTSSRHTIVKCEVNPQGTNRRAIITNRPGAGILPEAAYDEYADRGESENRNKELKRDLWGDRLSDHRYLANLFRLYLHGAAHNLLVRLRTFVARPPNPDPPSELPTEALAGRARKDYENQRRREDPLGEGHPCTWRTRLIKVGAEVIVSTRRVLVKLSACWPFQEFYETVSRLVTARTLAPD